MAFLVNALVVASLGLAPDGPVPGPVVQTTVVVPDGGAVLLGRERVAVSGRQVSEGMVREWWREWWREW